MTCGGGNSPKSPELDIINGLAKCLRTENSELLFTSLALDFRENKANVDHVQKIIKVFTAAASASIDNYEPEYKEKEGFLLINRVIDAPYLNHEVAKKSSPLQSKIQCFGQCPPLKLKIINPGLLDSLRFVKDEQ